MAGISSATACAGWHGQASEASPLSKHCSHNLLSSDARAKMELARASADEMTTGKDRLETCIGFGDVNQGGPCPCHPIRALLALPLATRRPLAPQRTDSLV